MLFKFDFLVQLNGNGGYGGLNYGCNWIFILFLHGSHVRPTPPLPSLSLSVCSHFFSSYFLPSHLAHIVCSHIHILIIFKRSHAMLSIFQPNYSCFFFTGFHLKKIFSMWYWSCDCLFLCTLLTHEKKSSSCIESLCICTTIIIINGSVKMSL